MYTYYLFKYAIISSFFIILEEVCSDLSLGLNDSFIYVFLHLFGYTNKLSSELLSS